MQQVSDAPECNFCHSIELELLYNKDNGIFVHCSECGFSRLATNEHITSETITLLAG